MMHSRLVDAYFVYRAVKVPDYANQLCYEVAVLPTIPRVWGDRPLRFDFPLCRLAPPGEKATLGADDATYYRNVGFPHRETPDDYRPCAVSSCRFTRIVHETALGRSSMDLLEVVSPDGQRRLRDPQVRRVRSHRYGSSPCSYAQANSRLPSVGRRMSVARSSSTSVSAAERSSSPRWTP